MQVAPRHAGLDALRGALAVLVVLHHTAITYGAIGGWYYRELPPDGGLASTLLVNGLLLGPATIALAQTAHGRPFGATLLALWQIGRAHV